MPINKWKVSGQAANKKGVANANISPRNKKENLVSSIKQYDGPTYSSVLETENNAVAPNASDTGAETNTGNVPETEGEAGAESTAPSEYLTYLERKKQDAYGAAEAERERAVVDAQSAYRQNLAEYGANAERLASMGLTGSGYGEYLDSRAYATMRGEIQGAHATETTAKKAADTAYYEDMLVKSEKDNTNFTTLMNGIKDGSYSASDISTLASKFELSGEDTSSLIGFAQEQLFNTYKGDLINADVTEIDAAKENGNLSEPQYNELKELWNREVSANLGAYLDGSSMTKNDALSAIEAIRANGWADEPTLTALEEKYAAAYTPARMNVQNMNGGYNEIVNLTDDFQVKDANGNTYWVMSEGIVDKTSNANLYQIAEDVEEGELFGYDGKLYLRYGGNVYSMTGTGDGREYSVLYDSVFASGDSESSLSSETSPLTYKEYLQQHSNVLHSYERGEITFSEYQKRSNELYKQYKASGEK